MSHFTRIRTKLRNLETVRQALQELGYTVNPRGVVRGFGGQTEQADLVVQTETRFDVGFRAEAGHIVMVGDFWGLPIDRERFLQQVTQRYAYLTVMQQAVSEGWQAVAEEVQPDGSIRLVMQRWD